MEKQALVLLNGIFFKSTLYKGLIALLEKKYTVIPHTAEFQRSQSIAYYVEVLHERLKTVKNPILMGHSAGSLLAIAYAKKHPVKELVLLEPPFGITFSATLLWRLYVVKCFLVPPWWLIRIAVVALPKTVPCLFNGFKPFHILRVDWEAAERKLRCKKTVIFGERDELKPNISEDALLVDGTHDWPLTHPELINVWLEKK